MNRSMLNTSLCALLGALALAPATPAQPAQEPVPAPTAPKALEESDIGLTLFRPRFEEARVLISFANALTEPRVHYLWINPASGGREMRFRERFVELRGSVCIQGDDASRKEAIKLLNELDEFIGSDEGKAPRAEQAMLVRTVRLKTVSVDSAVGLLDAMAEGVEKEVVRETGTIVLRGQVSNVARAESLLKEVDQPSPQMTVHITLVEAAADGGGSVDAELSEALGALLPGKALREVGRFMTRASVSGSTPLTLTSNFAGESGMPPPRFRFNAGSRAWDPTTRTLTLGRTELQVETPIVQTVATAKSPGQPPTLQQSFSGYGTAGITTDLALRANERTVVGTIGDNSLFVVLRVEVQ